MAIDVNEMSLTLLCKECDKFIEANQDNGASNVAELTDAELVELYAKLGITKQLSKEQSVLLQKIVAWDGWEDIRVGARKEYRMSSQQFDRVKIEYWKFLVLCACSD